MFRAPAFPSPLDLHRSKKSRGSRSQCRGSSPERREAPLGIERCQMTAGSGKASHVGGFVIRRHASAEAGQRPRFLWSRRSRSRVGRSLNRFSAAWSRAGWLQLRAMAKPAPTAPEQRRRRRCWGLRFRFARLSIESVFRLTWVGEAGWKCFGSASGRLAPGIRQQLTWREWSDLIIRYVRQVSDDLLQPPTAVHTQAKGRPVSS
jgi:hypothetical protein